MKQIPILGLGYQSGYPSVTSQTRVNCYLEAQKDAEKTRIVAYGTPGKTLFCNLGSSVIRGFYSYQNLAYFVYENGFYTLNNAGVATRIGSIGTSSGTVYMSCNSFQIFIADGTANSYYYTFSSGLLAQANNEAVTTSACVDGYIVGNKPGTLNYIISGLYDCSVWNPLDIGSAETSPDYITRVSSDHGTLILSGEFTTELHANNGAQDFPFALIGYSIEWGLTAVNSVAKLGDALCFLARNRLGQSQVVLLQGYDPQVISTPDIDRIINASTTIEAATAFSYMLGGHQFYQINVAGISLLYDSSSGVWTTVKSYGKARDKGDNAINLVNRILVSDYSTGKIYTMSSDVYNDDGDPLVMQISGKHLFNNAEWMSVSELDLEMENGNGATTGQGTIPQVLLEVSKDSGHTWGSARWASSGEIGKHKTLIRWPRLGRSYNFDFRITISDPVKRAIIGAWIIAK